MKIDWQDPHEYNSSGVELLKYDNNTPECQLLIINDFEQDNGIIIKDLYHMIKTIIFDLEGVFFIHKGFEKLRSKYDINEKELKSILKEYNKCAISKEKSEDFWKRFCERFDIKDSCKDVRKLFVSSSYPLNKNINIIKILRESGYKVLFLSNTHIDITLEHNKKYKFRSHFDDGLFSHECKFFKPDIRFYEELLTKANTSPRECIYIDDRKDNIKPASELGMKTILFKNHEQLIKDLKGLCPHLRI